MTTPTLRIVAPGPICTIQDNGRFGYQRFGISTSGAVDPVAYALANRLLGNSPNAAALEITFGGFEAEFLAKTTFALTGADLTATLNDTRIPRHTVLAAVPGDRVALPAPRTGMRAYLAVPGGWHADPVLGSTATYPPANIGGLNGKPLAPGDELSAAPAESPPMGATLSVPPTDYPGEVTARVIPGPQDDHFTEAGLATLFDATYSVTDRSDRQGIRLDGPEIEAGPDGYDIVSDAVVTGAIQVPGDRKPIVLMADRQTTGGYPKIAVAATADIPLLAQSPPGTRIRFARTTVEAAVTALGEQRRLLADATAISPDRRTIPLTVDGAIYEVTHSPRASQLTVNDTTYTISIDE